jgi:PhoPQ-activated pathogenicity-related protein
MTYRLSIFLAALLALALMVRADTARPAPATQADLVAPIADNTLHDYVARPDPSYAWKEFSRTQMLNMTAVELALTSQTWHGVTWKHRVFVLVPKEIRHPENAVLLISGGNARPDPKPGDQPPPIKLNAEALAMAAAIEQMGCPIVILQQVPYQPILDRREDGLLAFTFDKFLTSKPDDPAGNTWPLLLPMVKSAVRAMDASAEFLKKERGVSVDRFTVTGASKRGWTTWLTAAVDPRVVAQAPMVINMLNMAVQSRHTLDVWGEHSDQVRDYTNLDIPRRLLTPRGLALRRIIDPFAYRAALTQPKLIFLGSNDPYWPCDASNFYFDQLPGDRYLVIVPNAGHDLARDFLRIVGTLGAFQQHVYGNTPLPKLAWTFTPTDGSSEHVLRIKSNMKPRAANVWIAHSQSKDFRNATWIQSPMPAAHDAAAGGAYEFTLTPAAGAGEHLAAFAELIFDGPAMPFYLTSNINITP